MFNAEKRGSLTVNGVVITSKELAKLVGESKEDVSRLLNEMEQYNVFTKLDNNLIINRRMYYHAERSQQIHEARVKAGRKGGLSKRLSKKVAKQAASTPAPTPAPTASPTPLPKPLPTKKEREAWFEEAWKAYPVKDGKKESLIHYLASVKNIETHKKLMKAMQSYLSSPNPNRGYTKKGATWFNNWEDWIDYVPPKQPSKSQQNYTGKEETDLAESKRIFKKHLLKEG